MLRVLFCISCCSAPPSNRHNKQRKSSSVQQASSKSASQDKLADEQTTKRASDHNDQLLANQIQAANSEILVAHKQGNDKSRLLSTFDSESASTSSQANETMAQTGGATRELQSSASFGDIKLKLTDAAAAGQSWRLSSDDDAAAGDDSPTSSSIDIGAFSESQQKPLEAEEGPEASQVSGADNAAARDEFAQLAARVNMPSTTKIGDYARIEYSPVDDLESVTMYSRAGSSKGSTLSRHNSLKVQTSSGAELDKSARSSRRSSQGGAPGFESTSISIASQLSNEQLQQNLTNMLERSATSTNYPLFGTIGLPLGPPIEGSLASERAPSETGGKTTPETPGAALTSASQDSLSDASLGDLGKSNTNNSKIATPQPSPAGGNLIQGDSIELDTPGELSSAAPIASEEEDAPLPAAKHASAMPPATDNEDDRSKASTTTAEQRVGSPQSYATTNSGGLTNPTPTPSELSRTSEGKKKKLKAKAVLKRFKFGGSKKSKNKADGDDVS